MDVIKLLVVLALVAIVGSLGKGLFHMSANSPNGEHSVRMVRALTVRIGVSVGLFLLLLLAWYCGALKPHGIG